MLTDPQRRGIVELLLQGRGGEAPGRIARRPAGMVEVPQSFGQEQLWFIDRFAPGRAAYNIPRALRLSGPLDVAALRRAKDGLVARHEALRTRLMTSEHGHGVQVIDPPAARPLDLVDLSALESGKRQIRLREIIDAESLRPFDLAAGPLLRTWLLRLAATEHVLLVVVHHAVFDGWSAAVFLRELAALYAAEATGVPTGLDELSVQFADFALWERDQLNGPALEELEGYWRKVMTGFPTVQLPADRPRPVLDSFDGGLVHHLTDPELLDGLRELSRRESTTPFVTLMAALHVLLYRYTGQTDLVVGTVSANRGRPELAPLIGFLVNTFPIRADLSGDPTFTELLTRVRDATLGAYAHQDLPFAKLVETLRVDRDPGRAPLFQIALSYAERDTVGAFAAGVEFVFTDLVAGIDEAKFDLDFIVEGRDDGLWFECSYKTGLFDPATVQRLVGNFEVLLRGVVADPSARISQLPVLTDAELRRELTEWNDTAAPFPPACVHHGFETQVAAAPDAVAAEFSRERLSYAELNRRANQIARALRELGVGPEILVGVCMRTGLPRLAALLGIWKAGGGYVPLDPALPAKRLSFMITDTGMPVVLADDSTLARLPLTVAAVVSLDAIWPAIRERDDTDLTDADVCPSNVAYVIYTSGSTGQPKGVVVEHRQVVNFLHGMIETWRIGASDSVLQFASLSFDSSVVDTFMPLLAGARVVLAAAETLHSPPRLAALIREARITFADLTPSVLGLLRDDQFDDLRVLLTGGEELPSELARRWMRPGLRFVNDYGPTEATVSATYQELDASTVLPPPIGLPKPNYRAYVLDPDLNPVPVGVTGELHIGGAGVARGYLNQPELTRQRFIIDPFTPGQRLYKTGDLVRRRADGTIMFIGRIDNQVKIRGLRIEPGEIETALASHAAITRAVVTVVSDPAGEKQLAAYLRPEPGTDPDPADVRAHLARTLPAYMIPTHLITVEAFPINTSGKIDRSALPTPDRAPAAARHAAPVTVTETILVGLYGAVLGRDQVSATDSFFDIGGSSLQVMRLVDMINNEVGVDVGVAAVFLHPTPQQLAARIDAIRSGTAAPANSGPLVELSSGAAELPLFLIHAIGGTVFGYAELARELGGTFKVYGVQAPGLSQPGTTAASLAGLVADYTQRIRMVQPQGPYRLAGWSMGGIVAFEIARSLEQADAVVALLALLDAPFTLPELGTATEPELAGMFLADVAHSLGWDLADPPDPATATADDQLAWLAARVDSASDKPPGHADHTSHDSGADRSDRPGHGDRVSDRIRASTASRDDRSAAGLRRRFDVFHAHTLMLAGYQPAGPAVHAPTLIVSAEHSSNALTSALWPRMLSGSVATFPLDADHYTFLRPPLVAEVGTAILRWHGDTSQEHKTRHGSGEHER